MPRKEYRPNRDVGCNFFQWIDPPFGSQAEATIAKLVNKNKEIEMKLHKVEDELKKKDEEMKAKRLSRIEYVCVVVVLCITVIWSTM